MTGKNAWVALYAVCLGGLHTDGWGRPGQVCHIVAPTLDTAKGQLPGTWQTIHVAVSSQNAGTLNFDFKGVVPFPREGLEPEDEGERT